MCKYCGGHALYNPQVCTRCHDALVAVRTTEAKVLESIIRDVHVSRFMEELYRKLH